MKDLDFLTIARDFIGHRKTVKLRRLAGHHAPAHLILLWLWVYHNRNDDGDLAGLSNDDIASISLWPVETAGDFVRALAQSGFLDGSTNAYSVHNWTKRRSMEREVLRRFKISATKRHLSTPTSVSSRSIRSRSRSRSDSMFSIFWEIYPKKTTKKESEDQWAKIVGHDTDLAKRIIEAVKKHKGSRRWKEGFIVDPVRYLKHRRFEDELEPAPFNRADLGKQTEKDAELPPAVEAPDIIGILARAARAAGYGDAQWSYAERAHLFRARRLYQLTTPTMKAEFVEFLNEHGDIDVEAFLLWLEQHHRQ